MITAFEQTTIKDEKHENRVNERNNGVGNVQQVTKRMSVYPPAPFFPTQKHPIFLRILRPPENSNADGIRWHICCWSGKFKGGWRPVSNTLSVDTLRLQLNLAHRHIHLQNEFSKYCKFIRVLSKCGKDL